MLCCYSGPLLWCLGVWQIDECIRARPLIKPLPRSAAKEPIGTEQQKYQHCQQDSFTSSCTDCSTVVFNTALNFYSPVISPDLVATLSVSVELPLFSRWVLRGRISTCSLTSERLMDSCFGTGLTLAFSILSRRNVKEKDRGRKNVLYRRYRNV